MATSDIDAQLDRLYQLPLDEFTPARNALAKELKRPTIKDLEKPNIAAWAVNQLHWKERAAYNQLIRAGERLRAEHRKLLAGQPSDIREVEQGHRDAVRNAVQKIRSLLKDSGHATSDATMTAVQETLEALPTDDQPGRLTRPLKPAGFEALAGVSLRAGARRQPEAKSPAPGPGPLKLVKSAADQKRQQDEARQREKEERARKERQREAQKALKTAEAAMLRAEEAVKNAEKALGELRAKRDHAVSDYQRARLRARE
jgi:hypothetical protein